MERQEACEIFRKHIFKRIKWNGISRDCMQLVHDSKLLDLKMENEVLYRILWSDKEDEDGTEKRHETCVTVKVKAKAVTLTMVMLTVVPIQEEPSFECKAKTNSEGRATFLAADDSLEKEEAVQYFPVDASDVHVTVVRDKEELEAQEVSIYAMQPFNSRRLNLTVQFDPLTINLTSSAIKYEFTVKVEVAPALLNDLRAANLTRVRKAALPQAVGFKKKLTVALLRWETSIRGSVVLPFKKEKNGEPKMEEDEVPVISRLGFK